MRLINSVIFIAKFLQNYKKSSTFANNFQKLWKMCSKYKNYSNFSFIYDRENLTKKKDSPVDEGQEKFEELLKRRVIVK